MPPTINKIEVFNLHAYEIELIRQLRQLKYGNAMIVKVRDGIPVFLQMFGEGTPADISKKLST